jgi:hypothetical protein
VVKKLKLLVATSLVIGLVGVTSVQVLGETTTTTATAPPVFNSATYDVGKGELAIMGTNLVATTTLSKVSITDSVDNNYTLTTTTKGTVNNAGTEDDIILNSADQAALTKILDDSGTKALNGGAYQVNVLSGWDGTTSTTDVSAHALTACDVAGLTSAAYDESTGKLTLTGINMAAVTSSTTSDITPKYLTITDSATNSYTLTTAAATGTSAVKVTGSGTSATITLNAADQLALQGIFNANGTSSASNHAYNITAAYGWNGATSLASLGAHPITVSNYAAPTVNLVTGITVTYGSSITIPKNTFSKVGTIYVIPSSTDLTGATQATLDALVSGGTALKATASSTTAALSIPTAASTTNPFKFTVTSETFVIVEVDKGGQLSNVSSSTITMNNVAAPALTATASAGSVEGATKVTAAVTANTSDTLAYEFSNVTISTPKVGTVETLASDGTAEAGSIYAYTSGNDITGVDATTNKYLGIYELNSNMQVVKFKQITLSSSNILNPSITGASVTGSTLTISTSAILNTTAPSTTVFTVIDGKTSIKVSTVSIDSNSVVLALAKEITGGDKVTVAYTKPSSNPLQDEKGNAVASTSSTSVINNNLAATAITSITVGKGSTTGATEITASPNNSGDTLVYIVSSTTVATPNVGDTVSGTSTLTNGSDITSANATSNKYIAVYELDSNNKVVSFTLITLTSSDID